MQKACDVYLGMFAFIDGRMNGSAGIERAKRDPSKENDRCDNQLGFPYDGVSRRTRRKIIEAVTAEMGSTVAKSSVSEGVK